MIKSIFNFLKITKQIYDKTFFHPNYQKLSERIHLFKTLLVLVFKSKFQAKEEVNQNLFGFRISASNPQILYQLILEIFVDQIYRFQSKNSSPKIIDAGANMGISVLYFKHLYPKSRITAIEPNPIAFHYLQKNVEQNQLQDITLIQACLSDKIGKAKLYIAENLLNASIYDLNEEVDTHEVKTVLLSDFFKKEKYDLVKIDIEGAEREVFRDLYQSNTLNRSGQYIIEYHTRDGIESVKSEMEIVFYDLGFKKDVINQYAINVSSDIILSFALKN